MHIRVTEETKKMVKELAKQDRRSMASYLGLLIEKAYEEMKQKEKNNG